MAGGAKGKAKGKAKATKMQSRSSKARLNFPVGRIMRFLRKGKFQVESEQALQCTRLQF